MPQGGMGGNARPQQPGQAMGTPGSANGTREPGWGAGSGPAESPEPRAAASAAHLPWACPLRAGNAGEAVPRYGAGRPGTPGPARGKGRPGLEERATAAPSPAYLGASAAPVSGTPASAPRRRRRAPAPEPRSDTSSRRAEPEEPARLRAAGTPAGLAAGSAQGGAGRSAQAIKRLGHHPGGRGQEGAVQGAGPDGQGAGPRETFYRGGPGWNVT